MSILLSGYYPEGIVFAADKNATVTVVSGTRVHRWVEPSLSKVLAWPGRRAAVGFVGVAFLAGLPMDEWLRVFVAGTRDFTDLSEVASELQVAVQRDFRAEFSASEDHTELQLILHLGGFIKQNGHHVPAMFHIWNHGPVDPKTGFYPTAERSFSLSEDFERSFRQHWPGDQYPREVRQRLAELLSRRSTSGTTMGQTSALSTCSRPLSGSRSTLSATPDSGMISPASGRVPLSAAWQSMSLAPTSPITTCRLIGSLVEASTLSRSHGLRPRAWTSTSSNLVSASMRECVDRSRVKRDPRSSAAIHTSRMNQDLRHNIGSTNRSQRGHWYHGGSASRSRRPKSEAVAGGSSTVR